MEIKFREDWARGAVVVYKDGLAVYSNREYKSAATWAQQMFDLSDSQLMDIYYDYKEDYDS